MRTTMSTKTKWIIGIAAAVVVFLLLFFYSSRFYVWMTDKLTTLLIWLVIFIAGWLLGRYGGRRNKPKE